MQLVSSVDRKLVVPKAKQSFTNKEDWVFEFKAGKPLEVPDEVGKVYLESYPHVFSKYDEKDSKAPVTTGGSKKEAAETKKK